jgi:hypothetical protein
VLPLKHQTFHRTQEEEAPIEADVHMPRGVPRVLEEHLDVRSGLRGWTRLADEEGDLHAGLLVDDLFGKPIPKDVGKRLFRMILPDEIQGAGAHPHRGEDAGDHGERAERSQPNPERDPDPGDDDREPADQEEVIAGIVEVAAELQPEAEEQEYERDPEDGIEVAIHRPYGDGNQEDTGAGDHEKEDDEEPDE